MNEVKRIPLAWSVRWRRLRRELAPIAFFAVAVVMCGILWTRQGGVVHGVGEVDALRVNITSPVSGLVESFPGDGKTWQAFDRIEAGELIGRLKTDSASSEVVEIRAPVSGTLVTLGCWPGQTLTAGGLVAVIAADHGRHIVSYLPESESIQLEPGSAVSVRLRKNGSPLISTQIEALGRHIEMIPLHQNPNLTTPQWGLPVRIRMPVEIDIQPGTLVDVIYQ